VRILALATVLLLAAAGCSGKTATTTGPTAAPATATATTAPGLLPNVTVVLPAGPSVTIEGCTNFGGVFPVPMAAAKAVLPDSLTPVPAASDPQGGATLYVLALKCDGSSVDGASLGPALLAYEELAVTPDAAHAVKGISDYSVPLLFTAQPEGLGQALARLMLGKAGAGGLSWASTATGAITAQGTLDGDGFTLAGQTVPTPPVGLPSGAFVLFGVQDKQVKSVVNGTSQHGTFVQAAVTLQGQGNAPLIGQAQPATRGFSVNGFTLHYAAVP
jgi:hypothetical protein